MRFFIIGDIVGRPARNLLKNTLKDIIENNKIDFVIANGENASGGTGLTYKNYQELISYGIDVITMGNHVWDKKEIFQYIDEENRIIRPANYPSPCPGRGYTILNKNNINIGIMNLSGRVFLSSLDSPFEIFEKNYNTLKKETDIIILDFHAEATAEKIAMGWFADGKISLLYGTHTHVQTADEKIFPQGTGYITDVGMTGPYYSVLGVDKDIILKRLTTQRPVRHKLANGTVQLNGLIADIDEKSGKCIYLERYLKKYE